MATRIYIEIFTIVQVLTLVVNRVQSFHAHTIKNHVAVNEELLIRRHKVPDWMSCIVSCQKEPKCFSYNYQYTKKRDGLCELLECGVDQRREIKDELFYSYGYLFQQLKQDEKMKRCSTSCGIGWTPFRSHCYKAINQKKSWNEASQHCKDKGGNLTSIHSQEENDFLVSMGTSLSISDFWIGIKTRQTCCRDEPYYSNGTAIKTYRDFRPYNYCPCGKQRATCKCVKSCNGKNKPRIWLFKNCNESLPFNCKI